MQDSQGIKNDEGKRRLGLIPGDVLEGMADVLTFGARKYSPWNWVKGFTWSRLYDAGQRHLTAWNSGEDLDEESHLPHIAHALCCFGFLLVHQKRKLGTDDRHSFARVVDGSGPPEKVAELQRFVASHTNAATVPDLNRDELQQLEGRADVRVIYAIPPELREAVADACDTLHNDGWPGVALERASKVLKTCANNTNHRDATTAQNHAATLEGVLKTTNTRLSDATAENVRLRKELADADRRALTASALAGKHIAEADEARFCENRARTALVTEQRTVLELRARMKAQADIIDNARTVLGLDAPFVHGINALKQRVRDAEANATVHADAFTRIDAQRNAIAVELENERKTHRALEASSDASMLALRKALGTPVGMLSERYALEVVAELEAWRKGTRRLLDGSHTSRMLRDHVTEVRNILGLVTDDKLTDKLRTLVKEHEVFKRNADVAIADLGELRDKLEESEANAKAWRDSRMQASEVVADIARDRDNVRLTLKNEHKLREDAEVRARIAEAEVSEWRFDHNMKGLKLRQERVERERNARDALTPYRSAHVPTIVEPKLPPLEALRVPHRMTGALRPSFFGNTPTFPTAVETNARERMMAGLREVGVMPLVVDTWGNVGPPPTAPKCRAMPSIASLASFAKPFEALKLPKLEPLAPELRAYVCDAMDGQILPRCFCAWHDRRSDADPLPTLRRPVLTRRGVVAKNGALYLEEEYAVEQSSRAPTRTRAPGSLT